MNRAVSLAAVALLGLGLAARGAAAPPAELVVAPGKIAEELTPVSEGLVERFRRRLARARLAIRDGSETRLGLAGRVLRTEDLLEHAASNGAQRALLVDLAGEPDGFRVSLRLYDLESRRLVGVARARDRGSRLTQAADLSLVDLAERLGLEPQALPRESSQSLDELAATGRALHEMDRGELARAWRELEGRSSPGIARLRVELESRAQDREAAPAERARLLAARGEMDSAWDTIATEVETQEQSEQPDPRVLLAAGEIRLEQGEVEEARGHFETAVELMPENGDALVGLGRTRALEGDLAGATAAFERATRLEPSAPRALELQAEYATRDPVRRAELHIEAGRRAAALLSAEDAQTNLNRAVRLNPDHAASVREMIGEMQLRVREHNRALESFDDAIDIGGPTASRLKGGARANRGLGDLHSAETYYGRALELSGEDPESNRELGDVYLASGRSEQAVLTLQKAVSLAPADAVAYRSLARAQHASGDDDQALTSYATADQVGTPSAQALGEVAAIHRGRGDLETASTQLARAVELEPAALDLRQELVEVHRARGDVQAAAAAERLLIAEALPLDAEPAEPEDTSFEATSFDAMLGSFSNLPPELGAVHVLGVRQKLRGADRWWAWVRPRRTDLAKIEKLLETAAGGRHALAPGGEVPATLSGAVDSLFDFGDRSSLDASAIARVNRTLGTAAVFVAEIQPPTPESNAACGRGEHFVLELRRLSGALSADASGLANKMCVEGGLARYGTWNERAGAVYLALVLLVAFRLVRGWGTVVITFRFPPKTRPLFAVRLSRRRLRAVKMNDTGNQTANKWKIEEKLQRVSPFEKRLVGDRMVFRWVSARRKPYYVTVRGPMLDAKSGDLVGAYQEEKTVQARRGTETTVEFDMRPKECAIEVTVYLDSQVAPQASVSLREVSRSMRYARGKSAFLYAGPGSYTVLAAAEGRLAEREIHIESLEPIRVAFDLSDEAGLVFADCPEAVSPYLEGRLIEAADALGRAGQVQTAYRMRAQAMLASGDREGASREFEAAGDLLQAAELRAETSGGASSAELFEEAGEFSRAARAYAERGDKVAAARSFERAGEFDEAVTLYRELDDPEKLLGMLEQSGGSFEAAQIATELLQTERAMNNYHEVMREDPNYAQACLQLGLMLHDRQDVELAIEKLQEARWRLAEELPLTVHYRLACLLEDEDRWEEALEVCEEICTRELGYEDVDTRAEGLRKRIEAAAPKVEYADPAPVPTAPAEEASSRYEILGELGRGGMGVVFRARDTNLEREVALKRLPENLKDHPTAVRLFLREARSAAALNHPNIVTVYDAGQEGGNYFITMECLQGTGFDGLLKTHGTLSPRDVALLGVQSATGLAYAHANGIIHRDIKSSNLFYTTERVVKIMDFGLAKAVEEVRRNASMIAGTPYYMAPEQSVGDVVDHRADLYSLGVTLYQLVTGTVPFSAGDVTYHHRHTPAPDPREHVADLSATFAELLLHMLQKEPDARVQTATEVGDRLRAIAAS